MSSALALSINNKQLDWPDQLDALLIHNNLADLFRTTHKAKTHQVVQSRGQHCGDIELVGYIVNEAGPVPFVLDLRVPHDRVDSSDDPDLNGHLRYPNNLDQSLNDAVVAKLRKYRADYNFNPTRGVGFMSAIASTSDRLHREFIRILFLHAHRETNHFFAASGVMSSQSDRGFFHYHLAAFSSMIKSRVGNILDKVSVLRINLNVDGSPIASKSHTHPSHSQTSRLLTSSLSLGVPVPRPTQCL